MRRFLEYLQRTFEVGLIIFGLFLAYQILLKIIGGSWDTEQIITTLVMFNLGLTFTLGTVVFGMRSDMRHLTHQFRAMATDFKQFQGFFHALATDVKTIGGEVKSLAGDVKLLRRR